MNLQAELSKMTASLQASATPETTRILESFLGGLRKSGIISMGPKTGDKVADFTATNAHANPGTGMVGTAMGDRVSDFSLRDQLGLEVRLSELLRGGPVVLNFYRGNWCPACNIELRALQFHLPRFKELGAELVAISNEKPDESLSTVEKLNLEYIVLSDPGGRVARQFKLLYRAPGQEKLFANVDIAKHNGEDVARFVIPATYVIDRDFTVRYAFADEDFTRRADIDEILNTLRDIKGA